MGLAFVGEITCGSTVVCDIYYNNMGFGGATVTQTKD